MAARSKIIPQIVHDDPLTRLHLQRERERLTDLIAALEAEGIDRESEAASVGELADASQHQADMGSETFERERDLTFLDEFHAGLREVDDALRRLEAGEYGDCMRCGQPIGGERLEALPAAPYCKACEELYETTGALEERPSEPTVGEPADELEFLPDDDELDSLLAPAGRAPEEDAMVEYTDLAMSAAEAEDELAIERDPDDESLPAGPDVDEVDQDEEESEAVDDLEADLFTTIRRQLGEDEEPDKEGEFELDAEAVVRPRQPNEFLCAGCFQLKLRTQLADDAGLRCVDCVNNGNR